LVRYHGLPLGFLDKPSPQRAVITASQTARCDWLALLAEADVRGRVCAGQRELLDRVELFRVFSAENCCLRRPYRFPSDHARVVYFEHFDRPDARPDYDAFDDTRCEVVVMSGLPGSGKDHWRRANLPARPVVSLDALRDELDIDPAGEQGTVVARAKELAREYLRAGTGFVWNATNVTRPMRRQLVALFRSYGARVRIVYVEAPYREVLRRNRSRSPGVPRAVVGRLVDRLDVPDVTEAHAVEWAL
jgi:predicted kinase